MFLGESLPSQSEVDAVIITGSPAMVTDQLPWMENLANWLRLVFHKNTPILGICFGHQILSYALGGVVDYHPKGRELGMVDVSKTEMASDDLLFKNLPPRFGAHVSHKQTVIKLPKNAVLLAGNAFEPHHAFRVGKCAWGLQFHPEFSARIISEYIRYFSRELDQEKIDVVALLCTIQETPEATSVLQNFFNFVVGAPPSFQALQV